LFAQVDYTLEVLIATDATLLDSLVHGYPPVCVTNSNMYAEAAIGRFSQDLSR
jgi:hypothetical protein